MFVLKNAWRAVTRNKARNITFLIVCIAVSASCVVGLTIVQADEATKTTIYESQAVDAVINPKNQGSSKAAKPLGWQEYSQYAQTVQASNIQFTVYYYETANAHFTDLKPVGSASDLQLVGLSDSTALPKGPYGKVTKTEGKNIDFSGNSANSVMVSQPLAAANKLKVGSTIKLENAKEADKSVDMKVVGIFEAQGKDATGPAANAIYSSFSDFSSNGYDQASDPGDKGHELKVVFQLQNPAAYRSFKQALSKAGLSSKKYEVTSPSLDAYNRSVQPLHDEVGKIRIMLIAILAFGALLALVWLAFGLMPRANELGMAITIGVTKARIGWQLALETLLLTIPGLALGMGLGTALCPPAVRSATSLAGIRQMPTGSNLWRVAGTGLIVCLVLAIAASLYAAAFKTSRLYDSAPVASKQAADNSDSEQASEHSAQDSTSDSKASEASKTDVKEKA
ncbi:peptide ABC transporter permease [Bombiscardovia nodaiensis]|uniref:Peptide ABC transporter permease n=1 Tax=Bombiscardovia nodaiensis TaxID=2932181 RepID=A0ABM8B6K6_9BIFI|nr:peptide ABC transporter permease [Bombiscardovia nodaiensis]